MSETKSGCSSKEAPSRRISLIIPIYNESLHLESFLKTIDALDLPGRKELIFVEDCSTDDSRKILESFRFKSEHIILVNEKNHGKGSSVRRGIEAASGAIIGIQDADFEYDFAAIAKLSALIADDHADIAFGSRFLDGKPAQMGWSHYGVNVLLTKFSNLFFCQHLTDMETCYKFFRADIIKNIILTSDRFGFEPEVAGKISRLSVCIREIAINYQPRNYTAGKKISWRDGVAALFHILYFSRLGNRNSWFKADMPDRYL